MLGVRLTPTEQSAAAAAAAAAAASSPSSSSSAAAASSPSSSSSSSSRLSSGGAMLSRAARTVLVVGGTGRLGRLVVTELLHKGHPLVRVLVRPGTAAARVGLGPIFPQADRIMAGYTGTFVDSHEGLLSAMSDAEIELALDGVRSVVVVATADDAAAVTSARPCGLPAAAAIAAARDRSPAQRASEDRSAMQAPAVAGLRKLGRAVARGGGSLVLVSAAPAASKALPEESLCRKRCEEAALCDCDGCLTAPHPIRTACLLCIE
jgi:hypothetical protein